MASKMNMRQFNALARRAVGTTHRSRIRGEVALTSGTFSKVSLLLAEPTPDYDVVTNGSTIAEVEARSRLLNIDLNLNYFAGTNGAAGVLCEWLLWRDQDNFDNVTAPSDLFVADLNTLTMALRKGALAYGSFYSSANNDTKSIKVRISRAAMRRNGIIQDDDHIKFGFLIGGSVTGAKYFMHGTITTAK